MDEIEPASIRGASQRILYGEARADGTIPYWTPQDLWQAAEGLPVDSVDIERLSILDDVVWFDGPRNVHPTIRRIAEHARAIMEADLAFPIIMTRSGHVVDGAHRIAKAYLQGQKEIDAVVLEKWPPPSGHIRSPA
jgi:hypothetical protein